jgi:hypothetical protein
LTKSWPALAACSGVALGKGHRLQAVEKGVVLRQSIELIFFNKL